MSVVDVVITAGQSQMSGMGDGTLAPACDPNKCWDWDGGLPLKTVKDPTSITTAAYKAQTGSPIPAFANAWTAATGRPVLMVRAAVGGTSLLHANAQSSGDWSTSSTLFDASVSRAQAAMNALVSLGHTVGRVHVIWSQGYADAVGGQDLASYGAATAALVSRWRTALGISTVKVYIELMYAPAAAPNQTVKDRCLNLRQQQLDAVASTPGLVVGFAEGQTFAERHWLRYDNLHYSQPGLNYMGRAYAAVMVADLGIVPAAPEQPVISTSLAARLLAVSDEIVPVDPPDEPHTEWTTPGTYYYTVPAGVTSGVGQCEGGGGAGGAGGIGIKGGAGGGGSYALNTFALTPGEQLQIIVAAGGVGALNTTGTNGGTSQIIRVSTGTVLCSAIGGNGGIKSSPGGDGNGGNAAFNTGSTVTSGQKGGTTAIDNGGNGAAPLGGLGGIGPSANPGQPYGGGGAGSNVGTNKGGDGAGGIVTLDVS